MKIKNLSVSALIKISVVAALYAAMTVMIAPLSYGAIQFRFAEILVLLCFYKKDYCFSMVIGCLIANLFSPFAAIDVPFGTFATLLAVIGIYKSTNLILASAFPVILNGVIVGAELSIFYGQPFWFSALTVAAGELVVVSVIGVPIFKGLERNKMFMQIIDAKKQRVKE